MLLTVVVHVCVLDLKEAKCRCHGGWNVGGRYVTVGGDTSQLHAGLMF